MGNWPNVRANCSANPEENMFKKFRSCVEGAATIEYLIVAGLLSAVMVAGMSDMGNSDKKMYGESNAMTVSYTADSE